MLLPSKIVTVLIGVAAVLTVSSSSRAAKRLAVPDMRVSGADPGLSRVLTEILTTETAKLKSLSVISSSDIGAMLGFEKQKELLGCSDNIACVAEIGGALGVDYLLVSELGLIGKTYVLNAKLIATAKVDVLSRVYKTISGEPDALVQAVKAFLPELLAPVATKEELAALEKDLKESHALTPAPATGPTTAPTPTPRMPPPVQQVIVVQAPEGPTRWPGWAMSVVGVLGLGAAVVGEITASKRADGVSDPKTIQVGQFAMTAGDGVSHIGDAHTIARISLMVGAAGGALIAGGVTWLILQRGDAPKAVIPQVSATGAGASLIGWF